MWWRTGVDVAMFCSVGLVDKALDWVVFVSV